MSAWVLFFFATFAEVQPNPYGPLAVLIGAIVVYGILSLSLVLLSIVELIDRARVGRQASDVRQAPSCRPA